MGGVAIQDRSYRLRNYHSCFVGKLALRYISTVITLAYVSITCVYLPLDLINLNKVIMVAL